LTCTYICVDHDLLSDTAEHKAWLLNTERIALVPYCGLAFITATCQTYCSIV